MAAPMAISAISGCKKLVVASDIIIRTTNTASGMIIDISCCTLSITLAFVAAEPSIAQLLAPENARASLRMLSICDCSLVARMVS